jgi:hypothetical protein
MATTILGIDLGSYSVKLARLELSFRTLHLVSIEEQRLPEAPSRLSEGEPPAEPGEEGAPSASSAGEDTLLHKQLRTLEQLLQNQRGKGETSVFALGGEVTLRLLEMPFADAKKVAQALPFELSGQLMTDLDDQIVDQSLARPMPARPAGSSEEDLASLWLAACAPRPLVQERLAALGALGLDPRLCAATALAGAALFMEGGRRREPAAAAAPEGTATYASTAPPQPAAAPGPSAAKAEPTPAAAAPRTPEPALPGDAKDTKDAKDAKDAKEAKDTKDAKDPKAGKPGHANKHSGSKKSRK